MLRYIGKIWILKKSKRKEKKSRFTAEFLSRSRNQISSSINARTNIVLTKQLFIIDAIVPSFLSRDLSENNRREESDRQV